MKQVVQNINTGEVPVFDTSVAAVKARMVTSLLGRQAAMVSLCIDRGTER